MTAFEQLDELYRTTISKLPKADRLSYCNQKLDKVQYILEKNKDILDEHQKMHLRQMIKAAQDEIMIVNNHILFLK